MFFICKGYDDVFVMTNMIVTPEQTQGRCPEYGLRAAECKNDSQCVAGKVLRKGHGKFSAFCQAQIYFLYGSPVPLRHHWMYTITNNSSITG